MAAGPSHMTDFTPLAAADLQRNDWDFQHISSCIGAYTIWKQSKVVFNIIAM
jgi:hypothetical protein